MSHQKDFIISGKFDEYYQTERLESMTAGTDFDLKETTIADIYDRYDELIEIDSSIEKRFLGYGGNNQGERDKSLPIYEYVIHPPETSQKTHGESGETDLFPAPTILITTGVHGNEKAAVYGVYEFVRQMIINSKKSRGLSDLKANFVFRIIPIVNPGGYNQQIRNNLSEVDLNRNFSDHWEELDHPAKGSAPYSEYETVILRDWLAKNDQAFAYLDYHNFTRLGESIGIPERKKEMTSYQVSPNPALNKMYSSLIRRLSVNWKDSYLNHFAELGNLAYGFLYNNPNQPIPSTIAEAYYKYGIKLTAIPEITYNDPINPDIHYTQSVMELSAEFFINYILTLVDSFK